MVIYIDILLIINLIINYFLLLCVKMLAKDEIKQRRIVLSSFFGALYSLIILMPDMGMIASNILKLTASAVMILLAFGRLKPKAFIKRFLYLYLVGSVFAGIMYAVYFLYTPIGMEMANGIVYFNISAVELLLLSAGIYLILSLVWKYFFSAPRDGKLCKIRITKNGKRTVVYGLHDTGNSLVDSITGRPVMICSYRSVLPLIGENEKRFFGGEIERLEPPNKIIPYNTLGTEGLLPAFSPEKVELYNGKEWKTQNKMTVAVCSTLPPEYDCLLPEKFFEGD